MTRPEFQPPDVVDGLPNVLLLGDAISIGYHLPARRLLEGVVNVYRPLANCAATRDGLEQLDKWLGDPAWGLIHFNFGLHDIKLVGGEGDVVEPAGCHQVSIEEYERNLDAIVKRLKRAAGKLIWASTTPVPAGAGGRRKGDEVQFNGVAAQVMKRHDVPTNNLYAFAFARLEEIQMPANVHFTDAGSETLAGAVAGAIRQALSAE